MPIIEKTISAIRPQTKTLLNKGKEYDNLINEILNYDYNSEEEQSFPSIKGLQSKLNMNYTKLKRLIQQIYDDIYELGWKDATAFTLNNVEYEFNIEFNGHYTSFRGFLPVCPRIGEAMQFPFFKPRTDGRDYYYVSNVRHELTDEKQIVVLSLKCGFYNSYEQFHKDKDEFDEDLRWRARIRAGMD